MQRSFYLILLVFIVFSNSFSKEAEKKAGKFNIYKTVVKDGVLWLYEDGKNTGWYELRVVNSTENDSTAKTFLESLKFSKKQKGISIGKGAGAIIGDEVVKTIVKIEKIPKPPALEVKSTPLKIVFQPRANYTDEARENEINGVVRLKVIFQANGGIGSISVVNGLPYGLTETAIVAARKTVFIPQQSGTKNITVIKTLEYRFTLY